MEFRRGTCESLSRVVVRGDGIWERLRVSKVFWRWLKPSCSGDVPVIPAEERLYLSFRFGGFDSEDPPERLGGIVVDLGIRNALRLTVGSPFRFGKA